MLLVAYKRPRRLHTFTKFGDNSFSCYRVNGGGFFYINHENWHIMLFLRNINIYFSTFFHFHFEYLTMSSRSHCFSILRMIHKLKLFNINRQRTPICKTDCSPPFSSYWLVLKVYSHFNKKSIWTGTADGMIIEGACGYMG